MVKNLLSRKFIFAMIALFMGCAFVLTDRVSTEAFFQFVEWLGGLYIVGNVSAKVVTK